MVPVAGAHCRVIIDLRNLQRQVLLHVEGSFREVEVPTLLAGEILSFSPW